VYRTTATAAAAEVATMEKAGCGGGHGSFDEMKQIKKEKNVMRRLKILVAFSFLYSNCIKNVSMNKTYLYIFPKFDYMTD